LSLFEIRIPSSVETLGEECFARCESLATVTFESDSKLSQIHNKAIDRCSSLAAIWIPRSLETILGEYGRYLRFIVGPEDGDPEEEDEVCDVDAGLSPTTFFSRQKKK
jgi:hypothetical protein